MDRKKGQTIHSEARNVIRNVMRRCDEEKSSKQLIHPLEQANARVAAYCGVSLKSVSRIRKENVLCSEEGQLSSPGKKRPKAEEKKFHCSSEDENVIRSIIAEFYTVQKTVPTGNKLLATIREKIVFPWKLYTLYRLLKRMGFKWRRSHSIRKILVERPDIVAWRGKYLLAIQHYRLQNRNIIYMDETWVDNTICFGKCWQSGEISGVLKSNSSSHRLVIVYAGGENGFISGAELIYKSSSTTGDYHGQMDAEKFEKWRVEKLLPNIPQNSVIIMDNAPYHSVQIDKPPTKSLSKAVMIKWLTENNIGFTESMRKFQLYQLVEKNKPEKKYKMDQLIKSEGHNILRLPPYNCDLNPIELAWAEIKRILRGKNISTFTREELEKYTAEAIRQVSDTHWKNYCQHVMKLEREYWERDGLIEEVVETMDLLTTDEESDAESECSICSNDE